MSFDLYFWRERSPITADEAFVKLQSWEEDEDGVIVFEEDPRVLAFHAAMLDRFSPSETVSEDSVTTHDVWWDTPLPSSSLIVVYLIRSHIREALPVLQDLASEYGLVCYEPDDNILWPNVPGYQPAFTVTDHRGLFVPDPDDARVERMVSKLGRDNWFLVLDRADGWWVQAGYGVDAGVRPGTYAMEFRAGTAESHVHAETTDRVAVVRFMQEFLNGVDTWQRRHTWRPLEL